MITAKFCTCHDSCAVMACAKLCSDLTARNGVTANKLSIQPQLRLNGFFLVKWTPGSWEEGPGMGIINVPVDNWCSIGGVTRQGGITSQSTHQMSPATGWGNYEKIPWEALPNNWPSVRKSYNKSGLTAQRDSDMKLWYLPCHGSKHSIDHTIVVVVVSLFSNNVQSKIIKYK